LKGSSPLQPKRTDLAECFHEHSFSGIYDELIKVYPRMDEVLRGVDGLLTRLPLSGQEVPGTDNRNVLAYGSEITICYFLLENR
jgi:hypothetical protein